MLTDQRSRSQKPFVWAIGIPVTFFACAILYLSSCAEDTASISMNIGLDGNVQTIVDNARGANQPLGLRFLFSFSDRKDSAGNILVGLRPGSQVAPYTAAGAPKWETSQGQGFDYFNLVNATLENIPLGYHDTEIIVELLQQGGTNNQWFVVAAYCINQLKNGGALTKELLATLNGASFNLEKKRSCGSCANLRTYTTIDESCP